MAQDWGNDDPVASADSDWGSNDPVASGSPSRKLDATGAGSEAIRTGRDVPPLTEEYAVARRNGVPIEKRKDFAKYLKEARADRAGLPGVVRFADTLTRGIGRGVPFADDIAALGRSVTTGVPYGDALLRERAINAADDTDRPATSFAGQFAGGVAMPGGALGQVAARTRSLPLAERILKRTGAGAGLGGLYGGASGLGAGYDLADRGERALWGGAAGAAIGGGIPLVAAPFAGGARWIGEHAPEAVRTLAAPARATLGGSRSPYDEAWRRVRLAMAADAQDGGARLGRGEIDAAVRSGQSPVLADFGGEHVRGLARSAANTSPSARDALARVTGDRFHTQNERTAENLSGLFRIEGDPVTVSERLRAAARATNAPLYDAAYARGEALWGPELEEITRAPAVQAAMRAAVTKANNRVALGDAPVVRNPFVLDEQTGQYVLRASEDGSYALPNLAYWDLVKRGLDDAAQGLQRGTDDRSTVEGLSRKLRGILDERVPEYAQARGVASRFFDVNDAFEAGQAMARQGNPTARQAAEWRRAMQDAGVTPTQRGPSASREVAVQNPLVDLMAQMDEAERRLFQQGYGMELAQKALNSRDSQNVVTRLFGSPQQRASVEAVLGREGADSLHAYIRREEIMDRLRTATQGNSTTARQLVELGLAGGVGGAAGTAVGGDPTSASIGTLAGLMWRQYASKVDARVAREVGQILAEGDPARIAQALDRLGETPQGRRALDGMAQSATRLLSSNAGRRAPTAGAPTAPRPPKEKIPGEWTVQGGKTIGNEAGSQQRSEKSQEEVTTLPTVEIHEKREFARGGRVKGRAQARVAAMMKDC